MARRTPQRSKPPVVRDGHSSLSISDHGDDDAGYEEEDEEEEEEDEDRGDEVGGDGDDEDTDEEEDDEGDEEDEDDFDGDEGDDQDDEDEEEEEDDEEDEEELSAEDLEALANEGMVPLARLNQVLDQNRQLNDQVIALLKGGVKAGSAGGGDEPPPFDLKAKVAARNKAIVDGDEETANTLDLEIEEYRQEQANLAARQSVAAGLEAQATANAVASVRKAFPALDPQSRKFNEETLDIVRATANLFQSKGMTAADAIIKAAKRVLGDPEADAGGGGKSGKSGKKAAKAAAARDTQQRARDGKDARTQQQRLKDLARSKRIPPRTAGGGVPNRNSVRDTDDDDASTVTEGRFRRMSDQEKREARGDFVGSGRRRRGRG